MDPSIDVPKKLPAVLSGTLFTVSEQNSDGKVVAKCCKCNENDPHALVRGSIENTFNFWRHYERHHYDYLQKLKEGIIVSKKRKVSHIDRDSNSLHIATESKLKLSDGSSIDIDELSLEEKQELFDYHLQKFIVCSMKPFNTVDDPYFREMIGVLDSRIRVCSRRTLGRNLNELYKEAKLKMKASFKSVQYLSSTADIWSTKHRSFLGVTAHYLDENTFERRSAVLACRRFQGSHTFDQIAIKLNTIYEEYDLSCEKILSTVTDNAKNFVKAFEEFGLRGSNFNDETAENLSPMESSENSTSLCNNECDSSVDSDGIDSEDELDDDTIFHSINEMVNELVNVTLPEHLRCASHTLNLVSTTDFVKYIINSDVKDMHNKVMEKCRKLWTWAKRPKTSEIIKECLSCNLKYPTVVRWNTLHDALGDLVKYKLKLNTLLKALKANFKFTDSEIAYLEELHMVLAPIAEALDYLQGDNCYYGELIPVLCTLQRDLHLFLAKGLLNYLNPLVPHLLHYIAKRFEKLLSMESYNSDALAASTLIPEFKLRWIPESYDDSVVEKVKSIVLEACKKCITQADEDAIMKLYKEKKKRKSYIALREHRSEFHSVEEEFEDYLINPSESVAMLHNYPRLKKAFLRYNTSLCSSAPVERLFSIGGFILGSRRCGMSDNSFELSCILKSNPQYF